MAELQFAFDTLVPFIMTGVILGVLFGIMFAFIKLGLKLFPWIVGASLLYYFVTAMSNYPPL